MTPTELTAGIVHGAAELERTERGVRPHRLPAWVRRQFPDGQLLAMESQPSGVRLQFGTTATRIDLVTHPVRLAYRGADRPRGRLDVWVDGELVRREALTGGDVNEVDLQTGQVTFRPGPSHRTSLEGLTSGEKRVEIWLPHNETVDIVELSADAALSPAEPAGPVWVHHGSSISQGSNAAAPTQVWPVVVARRLGLDLRNLGFGGSAMVDPFMARVIRDSPADLISVKLGINVVNLDGMRSRTFRAAVHGFLDTVRDGHPHVPLLVVSPIFCGIHENTPGPGAVDPASLGTSQVRFTATGQEGDTSFGRLTLTVMREILEDVVKSRGDDPNLHYLDGTQLYGAEDAARLPLPDALHPDTETHGLIGERFADHLASVVPVTKLVAIRP